MRSVPISVPRTAAFPDKAIFTYSLLSLLKLFSYPTGNSGGPKVEVGSKRGSASLMVKQRTHIREVLLVAVGEVGCHFLGTWFLPLRSGAGIITRLHRDRAKVCLSCFLAVDVSDRVWRPSRWGPISRANAITGRSKGDVTSHPSPVGFGKKVLTIAFWHEPVFMNLHLSSLSSPPSLAAQ